MRKSMAVIMFGCVVLAWLIPDATKKHWSEVWIFSPDSST